MCHVSVYVQKNKIKDIVCYIESMCHVSVYVQKNKIIYISINAWNITREIAYKCNDNGIVVMIASLNM